MILKTDIDEMQRKMTRDIIDEVQRKNTRDLDVLKTDIIDEIQRLLGSQGSAAKQTIP